MNSLYSLERVFSISLFKKQELLFGILCFFKDRLKGMYTYIILNTVIDAFQPKLWKKYVQIAR